MGEILSSNQRAWREERVVQWSVKTLVSTEATAKRLGHAAACSSQIEAS